MSLISLLMPEGDLRVIRSELAEKLTRCGDGDAALLYLYMTCKGKAFQEQQALRDLNFDKNRYERACFTLTNLTIAQSPTATELTPSAPPRYTAAELRDARSGDHKFQAVCDAAEGILNRTLTDALLRTLYTVYDHIHLPAEVIIELLSYVKRSKGTVRGRDIEHEACVWSDKGILTTQEAQRYLSALDAEKPLRDAFYQVFGIMGRQPTAAENALIRLCLDKKFTPDAAELALSRMQRQIGSFSASYVRKMLTAWDEKGAHTVSEITALEPEISPNKKSGAIHQPPFGAPTNSQTLPPEDAPLADWEKQWLEEVKRRRARQSEE